MEGFGGVSRARGILERNIGTLRAGEFDECLSNMFIFIVKNSIGGDRFGDYAKTTSSIAVG